MKNKYLLFIVFVVGFHFHVIAQTHLPSVMPMRENRVAPFRMEITYNKTTHLIFPAGIRYVDLGSEYITAGKVEEASNVLRIKASIKDFSEETNFSVITDDGKFYSFQVVYKPDPAILSYDFFQKEQLSPGDSNNDILFEEFRGNRASLIGLVMNAICRDNKKIVKHISCESYGIQFSLKGVYIQNGLLYFHTELVNKSNLPYQIDYVRFKIVDKKFVKRTVLQETIVNPIRIYKPFETVPEKRRDLNIFLLDQFNLANDKILMIEIFEKNGGRHQMIKIDNADLVNARLITDMKLKID